MLYLLKGGSPNKVVGGRLFKLTTTSSYINRNFTHVVRRTIGGGAIYRSEIEINSGVVCSLISLPLNETFDSNERSSVESSFSSVQFSLFSGMETAINPSEFRRNRSATSNDMKLLHWPLMGGLLHLVQRGGDWVEPQPAQVPPRCTKCNSPPINGQCTNHRIAV